MQQKRTVSFDEKLGFKKKIQPDPYILDKYFNQAFCNCKLISQKITPKAKSICLTPLKVRKTSFFVDTKLEDKLSYSIRLSKEPKVPKKRIFNQIKGMEQTVRFTLQKTLRDALRLREYGQSSTPKRNWHLPEIRTTRRFQ